MKRRLFLASTILLPAAGLLVRAAPAIAAEHEVQMLNKGPDGQRNCFAVVVPDGAEEWQGKLSEELAVTLSVPGLYAYKCTPHFGLGMVGLIVIGDPTINLEAVKTARFPGKARTVMAELLKEVEASI
jgi:pseudoazurin